MRELVLEAGKELTEHIIPFWSSLRDDQSGGFFGYVGFDLRVNQKAEKGCILNSRILWFFSEAYRLLGDECCLANAAHAYRYLRDCFTDREEGGVYWSLSWDGQVLDDTKHAYAHAFAIYALSAYYRVTGDEKALEEALGLYRMLEEHMRDEDGFGEAYDRYFRKLPNGKLSENGVNAERTMNTLLHIMEAYTLLHQVSKNAAVRESLEETVRIMSGRIFNRDKGRLEVFFDQAYRPLLDLYSYGHDIEAAWLIDRALTQLKDLRLQEQVSALTKQLEEQVYAEAFDGRSLPAECEAGNVKQDRVWWIQAEAVNGFLGAWKKRPEEEKFLHAAKEIWGFIKSFVIDPRAGSEWLWQVDPEGNPVEGKPIVEPWKCPYHNGRMCMELLEQWGKCAE